MAAVELDHVSLRDGFQRGFGRELLVGVAVGVDRLLKELSRQRTRIVCDGLQSSEFLLASEFELVGGNATSSL